MGSRCGRPLCKRAVASMQASHSGHWTPPSINTESLRTTACTSHKKTTPEMKDTPPSPRQKQRRPSRPLLQSNAGEAEDANRIGRPLPQRQRQGISSMIRNNVPGPFGVFVAWRGLAIIGRSSPPKLAPIPTGAAPQHMSLAAEPVGHHTRLLCSPPTPKLLVQLVGDPRRGLAQHHAVSRALPARMPEYKTPVPLHPEDRLCHRAPGRGWSRWRR